MKVTVIGAGLAGSEAAWQLAQRGIDVELWEMKPQKRTPAHLTDDFAELCCSNSLRSDQLENAVGLLKEEMRRLGSLILECAEATRVPSGGALAVDRHGFAKMVTEKVRSHPRITVREGEVTELPEGEVIVASGPLTSDALAEHLIDAGSAVAGCGPAFADLFLEALADGAVACGIPRAKAMEYAAMTMVGAAEMYLQTHTHPGALKDAVCSPGGSTIMGIRALEEHGVRAAAIACVMETYRKNKELGNQ